MLRLMMRRLHRQEEGFTLIELLVVIAIVALLAAFAAPKLYNAIKSARDLNGKADTQTVTSALDRYFFDFNSAYPKITGTAPNFASTVKSDLQAGYLKNGFSWTNAYGIPYLYVSDTSGAYYVVVDPGNQPGTLTLDCGGKTAQWTPDKNATAPQVTTLSATPTQANLGACSLSSTSTSFDPTKTIIITN